MQESQEGKHLLVLRQRTGERQQDESQRQAQSQKAHGCALEAGKRRRGKQGGRTKSKRTEQVEVNKRCWSGWCSPPAVAWCCLPFLDGSASCSHQQENSPSPFLQARMIQQYDQKTTRTEANKPKTAPAERHSWEVSAVRFPFLSLTYKVYFVFLLSSVDSNPINVSKRRERDIEQSCTERERRKVDPQRATSQKNNTKGKRDTFETVRQLRAAHGSQPSSANSERKRACSHTQACMKLKKRRRRQRRTETTVKIKRRRQR